MRITESELRDLIARKLQRAGLNPEHAGMVANVLVFADARGIHSHGALRVEYYAERTTKGGINTAPAFRWERTGPASGIFHGDNSVGHAAAKPARDEAIGIARDNGSPWWASGRSPTAGPNRITAPIPSRSPPPGWATRC